MEKERIATRVFVFNEKGEVLVTKYKIGNFRENYFDIPGGKIEEGETAEQTAIREVKEETGIRVKNLKFRGVMNLYTPHCHFILNLFICNEYEKNQPVETEDNYSMWMSREELLKQPKLLNTTICLYNVFIKSLLNSDKLLSINIHSDSNENISDMNYKLVDELKENKPKNNVISDEVEQKIFYLKDFKDRVEMEKEAEKYASYLRLNYREAIVTKEYYKVENILVRATIPPRIPMRTERKYEREIGNRGRSRGRQRSR